MSELSVIQIIIVVFVVLLVVGATPLRRFLSLPIMIIIKKLNLLPQISETERTALEAGKVWFEKDLFGGSPDFSKLNSQPVTKLSEREQAFIDGPTNELCSMLNEWKILKERGISKDVWDFLKRNKFLAMIIPESYGGLGFSTRAQSEVIGKIASCSVPGSIVVMVPNSLGPAELILHYGTEEQKNYYLPRLATGEEIPCFGLTETGAGSDAGSIKSEGVLFNDENGVLKIKLNWEKRWISLAGISTLIGLAFRLKDPDNILGKGKDLGITCALVNSSQKGVDVSRFHETLLTSFYNCATTGDNVVVEAEKSIIGGLKQAGKGWQMLMECLAAGRGVSLPAQSCGGAKQCIATVSAHATVRRQFGTSIGSFEGVQEVLADMVADLYSVDAMRLLTITALDQGVKPPIVTAISKYHSTEASRRIVNNSMDIMGGSAISMGPSNLIAHAYIAQPISITVEGANILTRTLMIFGQGAFRAHPHAFSLIKAIEKDNLKEFDRSLWGYVWHVAKNTVRVFWMSLTRGVMHFANPSYHRRYYQKLTWASSCFALLSDVAMLLLGAKLKFKESLSGRFADILSWMYIGTAVLKRHADEGFPKEDLPIVKLSMTKVFLRIQESFEAILANMDLPLINWFFSIILRGLCRFNSFESRVSDSLKQDVAKIVMKSGPSRDRLVEGIYVRSYPNSSLGLYEHAFKLTTQSYEAENKIKKAIKDKKVDKKLSFQEQLSQAHKNGEISTSELEQLNSAHEARLKAIQVSSFSVEEYKGCWSSSEMRSVDQVS